jgi:hypothetical protein
MATVVAVALTACGVPAPTVPPAATPAPTSAALTPSPTPTASPSPAPSLSPAELAALIADIEATVPPIRELEPKTDVPNRVVDEVDLRADLERLIAEAATPEEYATQARLGERLGFFPSGIDLPAIQLDLLGDQVLGYYDPDTKEMAVVQRGGTFGPLQRVTVAHEFTHALQDQHFGLDSLGTDDLSDGDRAVARIALQEGDASLLTQQWVFANLTFEEILEITEAALDPDQLAVLARMPRLISRQLEFPYLEGLAFANALFEQGGWAAVDAAFESPPDSTEQILHPEKYLSREAPLEVPAPLAAAGLGRGWSEGWSDTVGELGIGVWLEPTAGAVAANEAAAGWAGDRVVMLEGPDDAWLIAWQTAWDTPADADAFAAAAAVQIETLGTPTTITHAPGTTDVQVRIASVGELLRAVPAP